MEKKCDEIDYTFYNLLLLATFSFIDSNNWMLHQKVMLKSPFYSCFSKFKEMWLMFLPRAEQFICLCNMLKQYFSKPKVIFKNNRCGGHLAGSVHRAYDSRSWVCEFEPWAPHWYRDYLTNKNKQKNQIWKCEGVYCVGWLLCCNS